MKKKFLFNLKDLIYLNEIESGYQLVINSNKVISDNFVITETDISGINSDDVDILITNSPDLGLLSSLNEKGIVTIVFGCQKKYLHIADITIDFNNENSKLCHSGKKFKIQNKNFNFFEVTEIISILEWDTSFFEFPIAYLSCKHLTKNIQYKVDKFIKKNNIRLVEYLCDCHDDLSVKNAELNKYHFTDIRLTFSIDLQKFNFEIRGVKNFHKATINDIDTLKKLTLDMYKDSRYFYDGNFNIDKINIFYSEWLEKAILGTFDHECYCVKDQNKPIAFCTLRYTSNETVSIGLFGVSQEFSGKGIGSLLINKILSMCKKNNYKKVTVVTQGRNYGAQRLYQSAGFRTESTELWYHKWI